MKNITQSSQVLLITSFHRCGSSMVGKILADSGLFIGEKLVLADFSNPDGHFEDKDILEAHDEILKKSGSSWQFDGSTPVSFDENDKNYFSDLVRLRNQQHQLWGFKDPRSCLFLEDWAQILGETGNYLFLYRHYSQCIASLYRRHSRVICLNHVGSSLNDVRHLNFWIDANLAAKMWLAYNRKLLAFFLAHRDKALLVSQPAILTGYPLIEEINKKFNFTLNPIPSKNIIKDDYIHNQINQLEINGISEELYEEMDDLWNALNNAADAPSASPEIILENKPLDLVKEINSLITIFNPQQLTTKPIKNENPAIAKLLSIEEKINQSLRYNNIQEALDLLSNLISSQPLNPKNWILAGSVYMKKGDFEKAQQSYAYAIALDSNFAYFYTHLGLAFLAQEKPIEAEHFLLLATQKNPKNPQVFIELGNFYKKYQQIDKATQSFKKALDIQPDNEYCINIYFQYLTDINTEAALSFFNQLAEDKKTPNILQKYALLLMKLGNDREAMRYYAKRDKLMLEKANLRTWLQEILVKIPEVKMRNNFQYWLYLHWKNICDAK